MENNTLVEMLRQENAELKLKLQEQDQVIMTVKKDADRRVLAVHTKYDIASKLKAYTTVYDSLPEDARVEAIHSLVDVALVKQGAEFYIDDKGLFDIRKKDGTSLLSANHQRIKPGAFLETLLAENKLLVVAPKDDETTGTSNKTVNTKPLSSSSYTLKDLAQKASTDFEISTQSSPLQ